MLKFNSILDYNLWHLIFMFLPSHHTALIFFFLLFFETERQSCVTALGLTLVLSNGWPWAEPSSFPARLLGSLWLDLAYLVWAGYWLWGSMQHCSNWLCHFLVFLFLYVLISRDIAHSPEQPSLILNLWSSLPLSLKSWEDRAVPLYSSALSEILRDVLN